MSIWVLLFSLILTRHHFKTTSLQTRQLDSTIKGGLLAEFNTCSIVLVLQQNVLTTIL